MNSEYYSEKANRFVSAYSQSTGLKRRILLKRFFSLFFTAAWFVIWLVSAKAYFARSYATFNPKNVLVYITVAVLIILPFCLFKPQKFLTDTTFYGKIVSLKIKNLVGTNTISRKTKLYIYAKPFGKNRVKKITVTLLPGIKDIYTVGAPICKIARLNYPLRLDTEKFAVHKPPKNPADSMLCLNCGYFNPPHYKRCFECSFLLPSEQNTSALK